MKRYTKVLIISCFVLFAIVYIWCIRSADTAIVFEDYSQTPNVEESKKFLINTAGCVIPNLDPFDSLIEEYIFEEDPVVCNNGTPALVSSNLTSIYLLKSSFPLYNVTKESLLKCCYNSFWRIEPRNKSRDNNVEFSDSCIQFQTSVNVEDEFVKVKCFYDLNLIYEDYFAFVPRTIQGETSPKRNALNVLVVGLDSISRLNFIRQMPKTIQVLKNLHAVEFLGYNKVGDNTFPNLIPILTGLSEGELTESCWPSTADYFDKCPFIWTKFKEANYRTVFAEDASWMGLFNYNRKGFIKQPTHHYWGHFNYNALKSIGNMHRMNVHQCMGATEDYLKLLEYAERFVETMKEERQNYFGFFWQSSLSHDFVNKPKLGDIKYSDFLLRLNENGHLNNTALVFMSDHGIRWGGIRSTFQGSVEERLPFLFIYLPQWYRTNFPTAHNNLIQNTRRLTTPFDLHDTLEDLLNPFQLNEHFLNTRLNQIDPTRRSQSLFNVISKDRNCDSAGISPHFCTCQNSEEVNITDPVVKEVVNFSVNYINEMLGNYSECAVLELIETLDARVQVSSNKLSKQGALSDFTVTFKTSPGDGVFEATVRKKQVKSQTMYEMLGSVSRLNLYGKQSFCVEDFHLKLFCYCRQLILSGLP